MRQGVWLAVSAAVKCDINYLRLIARLCAALRRSEVGVGAVLRLRVVFSSGGRNDCLSKVDSVWPPMYNVKITRMVELALGRAR
jgi:hypothetical protein